MADQQHYRPPSMRLSRKRRAAIRRTRSQLQWQFFRSAKNGKHYWRAVAANGKIVAASSQGYAHGREAEDNARVMGFRL